jgi:hypothetical protein
MKLFIGAFFNAGLLGLALVVLGVLIGKLHPVIDLFAHFSLPARSRPRSPASPARAFSPATSTPPLGAQR